MSWEPKNHMSLPHVTAAASLDLPVSSLSGQPQLHSDWCRDGHVTKRSWLGIGDTGLDSGSVIQDMIVKWCSGR